MKMKGQKKSQENAIIRKNPRNKMIFFINFISFIGTIHITHILKMS